MLDSLFSGLRLADTHGDLFRNIVSLRVSEDLFDDLSDDPADWQSAINLELERKPNPFSSRSPIIHRPFEEAEWNAAIEFPFRNWSSSRFSDGTFGVWYGASDLETTAYETVHHWRNGFLEDAGFLRPGISVERKVYLVRCDAALIDFRESIRVFPVLVGHDYTFTHQVGARLHHEGHPGLVSKSARCDDGDIYAVLNQGVLSDPRQHCYLTYTTARDGITVERTPGETWISVR